MDETDGNDYLDRIRNSESINRMSRVIYDDPTNNGFMVRRIEDIDLNNYNSSKKISETSKSNKNHIDSTDNYESDTSSYLSD